MSEDREKMFRCECHTEAVEVNTVDYEFDCSAKDNGYCVELTQWSQGFGDTQTLWVRIMRLWDFLFGRGWYRCFIVFRPSHARKFAKYILNECDRMDKVIKERDNG